MMNSVLADESNVTCIHNLLNELPKALTFLQWEQTLFPGEIKF